jgi:hypothetical protein
VSIRLLFVLFTTLACSSSVVLACQVPVFRYALERWEPDAYEVVVFHRGKLSGSAQTLVKKLAEASTQKQPAPQEQPAPAEGHTNLMLAVVDLTSATPKMLEKAGARPEGLPLPSLVVRYPSSLNIADAVWSGELTEGAISTLLHSPARKEISRRLLDGDSVVWVLIESGNASADDAAFKTLEENLSALQKKLKLPGIEEITSDPEYQPDVPIELALRFSATRIARNDPAEALFVAMLMGIEADLKDYAEKPIAVPVFGRGRALYGLTGKGINGDTIETAAKSLIGPCSCTVKELNPGVDLLMTVDWNGRLKGEAVPAKPLPELPAFGAVEDPAEEDLSVVVASGAVVDTSASAAPPPGQNRMGLPILLVVLLGLGVVTIGSLMLRRQARKTESR